MRSTIARSTSDRTLGERQYRLLCGSLSGRASVLVHRRRESEPGTTTNTVPSVPEVGTAAAAATTTTTTTTSTS
eukprot:3941608-Rhodomonas_salina.4